MDVGPILIITPTTEPQAPARPVKVAIYPRLSATESKDHREGPAKRLPDDGAGTGYPSAQVVKDISRVMSGGTRRYG